MSQSTDDGSLSLSLYLHHNRNIEALIPRINFHDLTELDLGISKIADKNIRIMAQKCRSLEKLTLTVCAVTDETLSIFAQNCPNLKEVGLAHCGTYITDEGLLALGEHCHSLVSVSVWGCRHITDKGIIFLTQNCPRLEIITFCGCPAITDESLRAIKDNCAAIKRVPYYWDSTQITPAGHKLASSIHNYCQAQRSCNDRDGADSGSAAAKSASCCGTKTDKKVAGSCCETKSDKKAGASSCDDRDGEYYPEDGEQPTE
jgi:hypothetical protein